MSDDYGFRPRKGFGKDGEPMGNRWGTTGERGGNRGVFLGNLIFPLEKSMVFHAFEGSWCPTDWFLYNIKKDL